MRCRTVGRKLSVFLENAVTEEERREFRLHIAGCTDCAEKVETQKKMRASLRGLAPLIPPADLKVRLEVLASKERLLDRRAAAVLRRWLEVRKIQIDNIMKPIALPVAGGLLAAILLFSALTPAFTLSQSPTADVPLGVTTDPEVKSMAPIGFPFGNAEVDLRIDGQGRILNYSIVSVSGQVTDAVRHSIENNLLFTTFTPATMFGMPITSTLRLSFQSSSIDVKG